MPIDPKILIAGMAAVSITIAAMLGLRPIAYVVDLIDRPGGHKTHNGEVPVVGGIAMLVGLVFGLAAGSGLAELQNFIFSATLLVVVGLLDDRFNLPPQTRLVAQFAAVLPMFFGAGVRVVGLGDMFGTGPIDVSAWSLVATAFLTLSAINAFNMLDGLDGLAGGIALVTVLLLSLLAGSWASAGELTLLAVLAGAILGFLVFNVPIQANRRIRCFMGDAGSTLLGFSLAWLAIDLSQGPGARLAPITVLWLMSVPAIDLVWTVVRRASRGKSPLQADNEHLHHSLLRSGLGVRAVFCALIGIALVMGYVGILLERARVPESLSLGLFLAASVVVIVVCRRADLFLRFVPTSLRRADGPRARTR